MIPSRGHVWLVEEIFLSVDGQNIPLEIEIQVSSLEHVQGPMTWIHSGMHIHSKAIHGDLGIVCHSIQINHLLREKGMVISPKHHSQGCATCKYYSKTPTGNDIMNHRTMMPSIFHMLLVEAILLSLYGQNNILQIDIQVSFADHV